MKLELHLNAALKFNEYNCGCPPESMTECFLFTQLFCSVSLIDRFAVYSYIAVA